MFQVIQLDKPSDIEMLGGRPSIRGFGYVVPSILGGKYVLYWKKMSRDEGLALMKKYPPYNIEMETDDDFGYWDYLDAPSGSLKFVGTLEQGWHKFTARRTDGPIPPCPIRLWQPRGNKAKIKERVDMIVDKWLGSEPAKTFDAWIKQAEQRFETGNGIDFTEWAIARFSYQSDEANAKFRASYDFYMKAKTAIELVNRSKHTEELFNNNTRPKFNYSMADGPTYRAQTDWERKCSFAISALGDDITTLNAFALYNWARTTSKLSTGLAELAHQQHAARHVLA